MALRGSRSATTLARQALRNHQAASPLLSSAQRLAILPGRTFRAVRLASTSTTSSSSTAQPLASSDESFDEFEAAVEKAAQEAAAQRAAETKAQPRPRQGSLPRWAETPPAMKGAFPFNPTKVPARSLWKVNEDPAKLDQFYDRMLGPRGSKLLPDEIKWLAVTHKSFDQGRRGFNDRLAFLGRQAFVLEVARSIVFSPAKAGAVAPDSFGRTPFAHPSLTSLDNLNAELPQNVVDVERMAKFALDIGLDKVLRWKPRLPENLEGSGINVVLNGAVHAIIGAISLQHGAAVAQKIIRERILSRIVSH